MVREAHVRVDVPPDLQQWPIMPADDPARDKQCDSKDAYLHLERALMSAVARTRQSSTPLRVYPCPWGLHWHLTSSPTKLAQPMIRRWLESHDVKQAV